MNPYDNWFILDTGVKYCGFSFVRKEISLEVFTLDNATYAVPAGIFSISNHKVTFGKVWPCALQMVAAYAGEKG